MKHTCIRDDGGTPNRRCAACDAEREQGWQENADHANLAHVLRWPYSMPWQFSATFILGMVARMAMSFLKYGDVKDAYPHKLDAIGSMFMRLIRYMGPDAFRAAAEKALAAVTEASPHRRQTGNTEYLIDAANFAMIEFMLPRVEGAFFEATDSDQSPGRISHSGRASQSANTLEQENIRRGGSTRRTDGGFYKREGD